MMMEYELTLLLPPGTITFPTAGTTIDLIWGNKEAEQGVIKCHIAKENDHSSDHLPIETILNLQLAQVGNMQQPLNYAKTNWKILKANLPTYLPNILDPEHATPDTLDQYAEDLTAAITKALQETTPRKRPSPFSKRWWNEDLTKQRREVNQCRRRYQRSRDDRDREEWKNRQQQYFGDIKKAKQKTWRNFVEKADEKTIWKVKKYMESVPTSTYIPTLNSYATSNEEKTKEFKEAFFPPPPPANLMDIRETVEYPESVACSSHITMHQLQKAVDKTAPDKAAGPDEISNRVLKESFTELQHHLLALVQASINIGHFPKPFKTTTTIVLRKPGKPDYTKPKAYRPIALENTIGKILESVMADTLSYLTEKYELLPAQHYGERPGRTAEDAMMILSENIHEAWKIGEIYSAVFMDVAGAFNNVHHERLIHNMRKRRMPTIVTNWMESFLEGRTTQLRFNDTTSVSIPTAAGIPQGSPLSPTLYMYYNGDILTIPRGQDLSLGFIDDIMFGVCGLTDTGNAERLGNMLKEAEEWRNKHGVQFEKSKYVLVHFTRNKRRGTQAPITMPDITIQPSSEARYLGVIFDQDLKFKSHLQYVVKKGTKFAMAMSNVAKATWGAQFKHIRQLFITVVATRTDYAASIWHRPKDYRRSQTTTQTTKLAGVQRLAMKAILGCFKTTSTRAMEIETELQPPHIRLETKVLRTMTRIQTLPQAHPLTGWFTKAINNRMKPTTFLSNLENLTIQYTNYATANVEKIYPFIRPPWWIPPIQVRIEPTKEKAKDLHDSIIATHTNETQSMHIYTDGSGINGHVGAAAYSPTTSDTQQQYLGPETTHNVFAGELTAMKLATDMVGRNKERYTYIVIYIDSQAAIKAVIKPGKQSGQRIICEILDSIENLQLQNPDITFLLVWIPGHEDILGNETADVAAKEAAEKQQTTGEPPRRTTLKSGQTTALYKESKAKWMHERQTDKRNAKYLQSLISRPCGEAGAKLYAKITSRRKLTWLSRLRTRHTGLNNYLHRFGLVDDANCSCGNGVETVKHYLLTCPNYERERDKLRKETGIQGMRIESLLGDPNIIPSTLDYVGETGRLNFK